MAITITNLLLATPSNLEVTLSDGVKSVTMVVSFPDPLRLAILKLVRKDVELFIDKIEP